MRELRELIVNKLERACELLFSIKPTHYQTQFIKSVIERKHTKHVLVASTRSGKTTSTSMLAVLLALVYEDEDVVVVAPTMRQSNILFSLVRGYFLSSPVLYSLIDRKKGFTREIIHLTNGSTIRMLTAASQEGLLGFGASTLIIDETASIEDNIIKTRLLRMLASPRNKQPPLLILLGTPHRSGFLYEAWDSPEFVKWRWTWRDAVEAGIMKLEEVEFIRKQLPEEAFMRWYEAEFIPETQNAYFDIAQIAKCMRGYDKLSSPPAIRNYRIYFGVDVARFGEDETAVVALKAPNILTVEVGEVVVLNYWRWSKVSLVDTVNRLTNLINLWSPDVVAVDPIGVGAGVLDVLAERHGQIVVPAYELIGRDEVFAVFKRFVEEGRILLPKEEFLKEQFASYQVTYDSWGRPKAKKTPGKRDDVADAIIIAFYAALAYSNAGIQAFELPGL